MFFTCRAVRWCFDWLLVQFSIKTKEELIVAVSSHSAVYMSWICKRQLPRLVLIEAQPGPRERFVLLWQLHHQRHPPVFIYWRYYGALPLPQVWVTRTWHNPRACFFFSSLRIFWRLFFLLFCCTSRFESLVEGSWRCSASYPRRFP